MASKVGVEEKEEPMRFFDNRTTTTTYLVLLASGLMLLACGGGGEPTTPLTDGAVQHDGAAPGDGGPTTDGSLPPDGPPPCTLDCDDGIDCTDDELNEQICTCTNTLLHGFCFEQEPGTICCPDQGGCCTPMTICSTDEDCPDLDPQPNGSRGPCMQEYCEVATATCAWRPLDNDNDGHAPQVCVAIDGDDCDDTQWEINPDAPEYCDGSDNDCNGEIDDLPELGLPCDSDPWDGGDNDFCEEGVWDCDGFDLFCTDNTNTTSEICDGVDNDCDGETDENWPNLGNECDGDDGDFCIEGIYACNAQGTNVICTDTTATTAEICNGEDDDCDGETDEGVTNACGSCGPVPQEVCDNTDNDCDGEIDEGDNDCGGICTLTAQPGTPCDGSDDDLCADDIYTCSGINNIICPWGPTNQEICNNIDDDCDGETDEIWPQLGEPCDGLDNDLCAEGFIVCNEVGNGTICSDFTTTSIEICNDQDDDCDGEVDEAIDQDGDGYYALCSGGDDCADDDPDIHIDAAEMCDGIDNNCSGSPDELWPELGQNCDGLFDADLCEEGIWECEFWGQYTWCNDYTDTNNEVCDGVDDDCDGETDEAFLSECSPYYPTACVTGSLVECACCDGDDNDNDDASDRDDADCLIELWCGVSTIGAPVAREYHTAVWTGTEMIVWSGRGSTGSLNTGGRYNPTTNTWSPVNTIGAPAARALHTAVWTGTEMIVWGGCLDGTACYFPTKTGGRYNPATDTWASLSIINAPSARWDHTAVWTGTEMIVWGYSNTGGKYNPSADTWIPTSTIGAPGARYNNTAVWTGTEMIVWGGDLIAVYNTGGRYDPDPTSDTWVAVNLTEAPVARTKHTAVWTGTEMIVWGGCANSSCGNKLNTGGKYNPVTNLWDPLSTIESLLSLSGHTAVWTGTEMIVWGGAELWTYSDTGVRYDPATNTWQNMWSMLDTSLAPTARIEHTAVWTGTEMIVWGGWNEEGYLNTGGRYFPPP